MASDTQMQSLFDATVHTADGTKIGKVGQVYLDDSTGEPEWVTVKTGMFGSAESFVPLAAADVSGDDIRVPYTKDRVKDAPRMDTDAELSPAEEDALYAHYGLASTDGHTTGQTPSQIAGQTSGHASGQVEDTSGSAASSAAGTGVSSTAGPGDRRDRAGEAGVEGRDTSGPTTDDAMTRSEEKVTFGTQTRESGKARLRKHVVTEQVTADVPVSHQEAVIEREPITDANRGEAYSGGDLTEEEHEVVLHEERATVDKTVEAVERVRLGTETVTDTETVSADARREEIEVDKDVETRAGDADRR